MANKMLEAALDYRKTNLSVIPVGKDKRPLISWKEYQDRHATEDEIKKWWTDYPNANVGIVTGKISGLAVLDCDSQDAITAFLTKYKGQTPAAKTPRGMHYYFKYEDGIRNTVKVGNLDMDIRGEGGYVVAPPSINDKGLEYKWHRSIKDSLLDSLLASLYIGVVRNLPYNSLQTLQILTEGRRDEDLFHAANTMIKGNASPEFVREVLKILASSCNPPFPEKEIEAKLNSAIERARRKERNIKQEILEFISLQDTYWFLTDAFNTLQLLTKEEKNHAMVVIHRLWKEDKIIERYGNKRGCYRAINQEYETLNILDAPDHPLDFDFPMSISDHCRIYPKNVILISGIANMGKSALAFELARLNQKLFPGKKIRFQTTEAGDTEIKSKLNRYPQEIIPIKWWVENVEFIPKADNWADIIDPDGLNVVDYISDYLEAYKIPYYIQLIHTKLREGVAVLVIQKDPNKPHGQGGQATRHAARLAIDIERKKMTLVKVKSPIKQAPEYYHPDGAYRNFELKDTWKFIPVGDWMFQGQEQKREYEKHGIIIDTDFPSEVP